MLTRPGTLFVQITEALAVCSMLCTTMVATLELGVAIFGHVTWCCCGYPVERNALALDADGNYKYESQLKVRRKLRPVDRKFASVGRTLRCSVSLKTLRGGGFDLCCARLPFFCDDVRLL